MKSSPGYLVILFVVVLVALILGAAIMLLRHHKHASEETLHQAAQDIIGGGPFRLKVSDPEYTDLLNGKKTIEARLDRPPFNRLAAGDPVVVVRSRPQDDPSEYPGGKYKYNAEVVRVQKYKGIESLLKGEGVTKVYPDKTTSAATARFGMYLPEGTPASDPVLAIELRASNGAKSQAKSKKTTKASKNAAKRWGLYDGGEYSDDDSVDSVDGVDSVDSDDGIDK
jgi:ASC-1-like (ASCH) protein